MIVSISVLAGLVITGYGIARVITLRGRSPNVQKLFGAK